MPAPRKRRDNASNNPKSATASPVIQEKLSKALIQVRVTKDRTAELHMQWRAHLYRISLIIGVLALHQCQRTMRDCLNNIALISDTFSEGKFAELRTIAIFVCNDSICEILNVGITIALFTFLTIRDPHGNFLSQSFRASSILAVLSVAAFCNMQSNGSNARSEIRDETNDQRKRQFPVAVIFHAIVAACYWFMDMGIAKCDQSIQLVENFEIDLKQQKKVVESKKKK